MYPLEYASLFRLLQHFYGHELCRIAPEDWKLVEAFIDALPAKRNDRIRHALQTIAQAPATDAFHLEYDFNRLFVGPQRACAAPYETIYRSDERTLMQRHTLSVRDAYRRAGMQVGAKNKIPDDHIAFECAFAAFLIEKQTEEAQQDCRDFLSQHLGVFAKSHADMVCAHTENAICRGFARLLEATTESLLTTENLIDKTTVGTTHSAA